MNEEKAGMLMIKLRAAVDGEASDETLTALTAVMLECIALSTSGISKLRVLKTMLDDNDTIIEEAREDWRMAAVMLPLANATLKIDAITLPKTHLAAAFDIAIHSADFGSGFLDDAEVDTLRSVAVALGVDPTVATPSNHRCRYEHHEFRLIPERAEAAIAEASAAHRRVDHPQQGRIIPAFWHCGRCQATRTEEPAEIDRLVKP